MTTVLRRILAAALVAALAGIGAVIALLGRRPRAHGAKGPIPVANPQPITSDAPDHSTQGGGTRPWPQRAQLRPTGVDTGGERFGSTGGGRGFAVGLVVCLLLLTGLGGLIYQVSGAVPGTGHPAPDGDTKPLAALSPPDAGTARTPPPAGETPTGSVRRPEPGTTADRPPSQPPAGPAPSFDVVRVEPNGDTVIAGRAAPNAEITMLLNGKPVASARAGADGHVTFTPPPLPAGHSEIALRATDERGDTLRSTARVAVVIAQTRDTKPLVAVTAAGQPTLVLSQPDAGSNRIAADAPASPANRADAVVAERPDTPAPARNATNPTADSRGSELGDAAGLRMRSGREDGGSSSDPAKPAHEPNRAAARGRETAASPKVVSIDAQDGGKLFVTARAAPGAALRLYLNETLIAPATVGRDGTVTFTVGRGLKPGDYKVRLDLVDPRTGRVGDPAEVPFTAPDPGNDAGVEYSARGQGPAREAAGPEAPDRHSSAATISTGERRVDPVRPATTGSLAATMPPGAGTASSDVQIPGIETARIERGDSLWRISRRVYGEGERYTLIFDANKDQIRDPDLIFPGQIFVLPQEHDGAISGDEQPH